MDDFQKLFSGFSSEFGFLVLPTKDKIDINDELTICANLYSIYKSFSIQKNAIRTKIDISELLKNIHTDVFENYRQQKNEKVSGRGFFEEFNPIKNKKTKLVSPNFYFQEGFYWIYGNQTGSLQTDEFFRLYFNFDYGTNPKKNLSQFLEFIFPHFNIRNINFHVKIKSEIDPNAGNDSVVLYFDKAHYWLVIPLIKLFVYNNENLFKQENQFFTLKIAKGIGLAEEPTNDFSRSFGESIIKRIYDVLLANIKLPLDEIIKKLRVEIPNTYLNSKSIYNATDFDIEVGKSIVFNPNHSFPANSPIQILSFQLLSSSIYHRDKLTWVKTEKEKNGLIHRSLDDSFATGKLGIVWVLQSEHNILKDFSKDIIVHNLISHLDHNSESLYLNLHLDRSNNLNHVTEFVKLFNSDKILSLEGIIWLIDCLVDYEIKDNLSINKLVTFLGSIKDDNQKKIFIIKLFKYFTHRRISEYNADLIKQFLKLKKDDPLILLVECLDWYFGASGSTEDMYFQQFYNEIVCQLPKLMVRRLNNTDFLLQNQNLKNRGLDLLTILKFTNGLKNIHSNKIMEFKIEIFLKRYLDILDKEFISKNLFPNIGSSNSSLFFNPGLRDGISGILYLYLYREVDNPLNFKHLPFQCFIKNIDLKQIQS